MTDLPRFTTLSLALALALSTAPLAQAQDAADSDDARTLDAILVEGTLLGRSSGDDVHDYSGSRTVIEHAQLSRGANRSLDDALQRVPGVKIFDETGTGVLPQIMLRGLYESRSGRVQALLDGIPLSLAPYGQTSLSLFPVTMGQIDRIDIVRGGAAVQYGPNNVGGVINFVSRPIPSQWSTRLQQQVTVAGDDHHLHDTLVSTGGYLGADFGLQIDASHVEGEYFREHSDTEVDNIAVRSEWWLADDKLLKAGLQRYVAAMEMAGALSPADYLQDRDQATRPLDAFTGSTTRGTLTYLQDLGAWGPFDHAELSWSNFLQQSARNFVIGVRRDPAEFWRSDLPPQLRQSAPRSFDVFGSQPQLGLRVDGEAVSQQWTLGVRGVREGVDYLVERTDLDTGTTAVIRDWRFDSDAWAAYVSNAIGLFDGRLTITPGLRYEHLESTYLERTDGSRVENGIDNLLPGLTIGYAANRHWFLYADAQRSLRAPQVTQIVYGGDVGSELAWNYEAGARYGGDSGSHVDVGLYRIDFADQIAFDSSTRTFRNLGRTHHQGVELDAGWAPRALPGLTLNAGYAYLDAEQESGANAGRRVPYTSRHQFIAGATYDTGTSTFALAGYRYSEAFSDAANSVEENAVASVGRLPAYAVWNAEFTHTLLRRGDNALTGSLAVNNLFDREYWFRGIDTSPWGRQPAPGRTVTVGVALTF